MSEQIRADLNDYVASSDRTPVKWAALLHDVGKTGTRMVNTKPPEKVQFLGHEAFGANLVLPLLERLFPDSRDERRLVRQLIERHHSHHKYVDDSHYGNPKNWASLQKAIQTGDVPESEKKTLGPIYRLPDPMRPDYPEDTIASFPWLILLGFADGMACRGASVKAPRQRVAEIDLALLILSFQGAQFRHREAMSAALMPLLKGIGDELKVTGPQIAQIKVKLTERFLAETCPPGSTSPPGALPTREDVIRWGQEYLGAGTR